MKASKPEQMAWISFTATLLSLGYYLCRALPLSILPPLFFIYFQIMISMALIHGAAALIVGRPFKTGNIESDERDRHIEGKADRIAAFGLFSAVNMLFLALVLGIGSMTKTINIAHALFVITFAVHALKAAAQILYYRRGA